jgi:Cu+-exporting ATPase
MALERNHATESGTELIYTCPMHPEVESPSPGTCPKCGMALELKAVADGIAGTKTMN